MKVSLATLIAVLVFEHGSAQKYLIRNVTVIDTRTGRTLPRKNVLIENGLIQTISNAGDKKQVSRHF